MSDDYAEYLKRKHAAFQTPEEVVLEIVARATGEKPVSRTKLMRGNDNEVYVVATASGTAYVMRIQRAGEIELQAEAALIEEARKAGAPAPRVYLASVLEHEGEQLEFMVQDRVPGRPLGEVEAGLSEDDWARVSRDAGRALGQIHSVRAGGFYMRHADGSWDFPDWQSVMDSTLRDRGSEKEWILAAGFSDDEFAQMMRLIERYVMEFDCPEPVLCHADFLPEHIFVDDELRVCGVIDFGMAQGGHPIHDFATLAMVRTGLTPERVLIGYPASDFVRDRFDLRLHLHRLALEMGFLAHHVRIQHYPEIKENTRGLRETLEWLGSQGV